MHAIEWWIKAKKPVIFHYRSPHLMSFCFLVKKKTKNSQMVKNSKGRGKALRVTVSQITLRDRWASEQDQKAKGVDEEGYITCRNIIKC